MKPENIIVSYRLLVKLSEYEIYTTDVLSWLMKPEVNKRKMLPGFVRNSIKIYGLKILQFIKNGCNKSYKYTETLIKRCCPISNLIIRISF